MLIPETRLLLLSLQFGSQLIRWRRSASRQLPGPRRRATAVTPQLGAGGGAQAARAAVLQHKAAGNALFKQRRYAAAVDEYQAGLQALQLVLLDVVATGTGLAGNLPELMSLKADLSNNTAMALIKQAESGPSGKAATACQQGKLHGGSSKACSRCCAHSLLIAVVSIVCVCGCICSCQGKLLSTGTQGVYRCH